MRTPAFTYNPDLCVHCHACAIACTHENKSEQSLPWRSIVSANAGGSPAVLSLNISMACNHCADAACLKYCPANAYSFTENGIVLIDQSRCMGCSWCQWVCPYEAPRLNAQHLIEKCTFCHHLLKEGREPACTTACPTGALGFRWEEKEKEILPSFIPDTGISPRIQIHESIQDRKKQVFSSNPEPISVQADERAAIRISPGKEWGLVLLTYVSAVSGGLLAASFVSPLTIPWWVFSLAMATAALLSMGHLGKMSNAYRVFSNLRHSPLSREIAAYVTFSLLGTLSLFLTGPPPWLQFLVLFSSLLLLLSIDQLYYLSERTTRVLTHSGGSLLTGLSLLFFFAGASPLYLFFFGMKAILFSIRLFSYIRLWQAALLFFFRIGLLVAGLYFYHVGQEIYAIPAVLCAELLDRILFYAELKPLALSRHLSTFVRNKPLSTS